MPRHILIIIVVILLPMQEVIALALGEIVIDIIMAGITDVVTIEAIEDTINYL
jgi:hypothetical protein